MSWLLRNKMPSRWAVAAYGVIACWAVAMVFPVAFGQFRLYDDEGAYLYALHLTAQHQDIYGQTVNWYYGPAFTDLLSLPFIPFGVTHDEGRLVTLAAILGAAFLTARLTLRVSRGSMIAACVAVFLAIPLLNTESVEPMQPATLINLLVVGVTLGLTSAGPISRTRAALLGAAVATVALTKINIGVLLGAAVYVSLLVLAPNRAARTSAYAVLLLSPLILLTQIRAPWTIDFFIAAISSGIAISYAVRDVPRARAIGSVPAMVAAGSTAALCLCGWAMLHGTTARELISAVFIEPFSQAVGLPLPIPDSLLVAIAGAGAASLTIIAHAVTRRRRAGGPALVTSARLVSAGVLLAPAVLQTVLVVSVSPILGLGGVPAILLPRGKQDTGPATERMAVAIVAILVALQAYPTAGSQLSFAAWLLVVPAAITLHDLLLALTPLWKRIHRRGRFLLQCATACLALSTLASTAYGPWRLWAASTPLELAGSQWLRAQRPQAMEIATVVATIQDHCSSLLTLPNSSSFYLWTSIEPPPGLRIAPGTNVLLPTYQEEAARHLSISPVSCLLRIPGYIRRDASGPLFDIARSEYHTILATADYTLFQRNDDQQSPSGDAHG